MDNVEGNKYPNSTEWVDGDSGNPWQPPQAPRHEHEVSEYVKEIMASIPGTIYSDVHERVCDLPEVLEMSQYPAFALPGNFYSELDEPGVWKYRQD